MLPMNVAQVQNAVFDEDHRQMFLNTHGWTIDQPVGQDSSIRRYFRVSKNEQTAILMETVPDGSPHATPGHGIGDFIKIAKWLRDVGLSAPEIYEQDTQSGYLLLEDLGDLCFRDAMEQERGRSQADLYAAAKDVLDHIAKQDCPINLPVYYESHVHKRHRRIVDWYVPLVRQQKKQDGVVEEYRAIWAGIENALPPCPQGFIHVDFHAQNLMWLADCDGLKRCGILDFQGAMIGPQLYDIANLLEDARWDIDAGVKAEILSTLTEEQRAWFRILATQFHCRVIGQFIKQAVMDDNDHYLRHIPRLENYIHEAFKDPLLKPIASWFAAQGVTFDQPVSLENLARLKPLIRDDAL